MPDVLEVHLQFPDVPIKFIEQRKRNLLQLIYSDAEDGGWERVTIELLHSKPRVTTERVRKDGVVQGDRIFELPCYLPEVITLLSFHPRLGRYSDPLAELYHRMVN